MCSIINAKIDTFIEKVKQYAETEITFDIYELVIVLLWDP